jgi:hypothetical protein
MGWEKPRVNVVAVGMEIGAYRSPQIPWRGPEHDAEPPLEAPVDALHAASFGVGELAAASAAE